jgi:hypothetical protein
MPGHEVVPTMSDTGIRLDAETPARTTQPCFGYCPADW